MSSLCLFQCWAFQPEAIRTPARQNLLQETYRADTPDQGVLLRVYGTTSVFVRNRAKDGEHGEEGQSTDYGREKTKFNDIQQWYMSEKRWEETKCSVHQRILQQPEPTAALLTYIRVTWSSANYKLYQEMAILNLIWKLKRACVCVLNPNSELEREGAQIAEISASHPTLRNSRNTSKPAISEWSARLG